ncbi:hypothetical protein [Gluconobacter sp. Gdi]|uniref:hypothetical protein n=1 Tax=Gluconobacter sp. Gdi TaxID=2691888 RepID=UPI0017543002|nr:hypothetical protein [Gluconobacter sp. Gdi]GFE96543.1 hypothetical protein DmGdi_16160 [Gluconobacter sp. Gdi]
MMVQVSSGAVVPPSIMTLEQIEATQPNPDAALIAKCQRFCVTNAEWDRVYHGGQTLDADSVAGENVRLMDEIAALPARTASGRNAKLKAVQALWPAGLGEGFELVQSVLDDFRAAG